MFINIIIVPADGGLSSHVLSRNLQLPYAAAPAFILFACHVMSYVMSELQRVTGAGELKLSAEQQKLQQRHEVALASALRDCDDKHKRELSAALQKTGG